MINKIVNKNKEWTRFVDKDTKVLLAVSGGPDSMYLLWMMKEFFGQKKYPNSNLHIISCDHHTRAGIHKEMMTVQKYSHPHSRQCIHYSGQKTTEDVLRKRRHQGLIQYAQKEGIGQIYLGHHLDDRIETTLMHMQQGCGRDGFRGMCMIEKHFLDTDITIVRPLLCMTKEQIINECHRYAIPYHIDPTNNNATVSERNALRKQLYILGYDNNRTKSRKKIYDHIDDTRQGKNMKTIEKDNIEGYNYSESYEKGTRILHIEPSGRSDHLLYHIYKKHNKSIRPRENTLTRLAEQLHHLNASIHYKGITIQSKKYISIIKIKK